MHLTGDPSSHGRDYTVVLPLKGGPAAKSRLAGPPGLAAAIALDCLAAVIAARAVARVLVVTPDADLAAAARRLGAEVLPDPQAGLSAAITAGLTACRGATAVLLGDLPALRPVDLDEALTACSAVLEGPSGAQGGPGTAAGPEAVFVPDAEGRGTVLLAGGTPQRLAPRFGPRSAARHAATGAARLELDLPRLRQDVDTAADLDRARALGLGPLTLGVLQAARAG